DSGMVLSPGGFAIMLMMPIIGLLVSKVQARYLIVLGLIITALALFHMTSFNLNIDYSTATWARVYQSLGMAFLFVPINTVAYTGLPKEKSNNASALINLMRNMGGSFGIALVTTMLVRRAQFHQSVLASHLTAGSAQYRAIVQSISQKLIIHGA